MNKNKYESYKGMPFLNQSLVDWLQANYKYQLKGHDLYNYVYIHHEIVAIKELIILFSKRYIFLQSSQINSIILMNKKYIISIEGD